MNTENHISNSQISYKSSHILCGLERRAMYQNQKERIIGLVLDHKINVRTELDPITRNLYRRYLG